MAEARGGSAALGSELGIELGIVFPQALDVVEETFIVMRHHLGGVGDAQERAELQAGFGNGGWPPRALYSVLNVSPSGTSTRSRPPSIVILPAVVAWPIKSIVANCSLMLFLLV